jgi:ATP-binding cassette, subfamily B, bacterial
MPDPVDDGAVAPTIYDLQPAEAAKVELRRVPALSRQALQIMWLAGRSDFAISTVLQGVTGLGVVGQLLIGRQGLQALVSGAGAGRLSSLLPWGLAFAGLSAAMSAASAVQRERQEILGELVSRYVEGQVLDVAAAVDLTAFETPAFHNRMMRVRLSQNRPQSMVSGLSTLLGSALSVIGVIAGLLVIQPVLVPLLCVVFVPAWLLASRRGEAFYRFYWRMTPSDRERQYLVGLLTGREPAKEVLAFGLTGALRQRYTVLYRQRLDGLRAVSRRQLGFTLLANAGIGLVLLAILLLVGWLTTSGRVSVAEAGIAVAGVAIAGGGLARAGYAAGALSEAGLYLDDYLAFRAMLPRMRERRPAGAPPPGMARIVATDLHFSYPGAARPAVTGVNLEIAAGEVIALVGENGSGKTTLAKLLAGLYRPQSGSIAWDGVDIAGVDPDEVHRRVAVIFQDFVRYSLPAGDNIGLGRADALDDLAGIEAAARFAGVHEVLAGLPDGYRTLLGPEFEGGTDLSVGQWQRVALARAYFRNAPFVILDEPTAALDPKAEHELFVRIRELLAGRTVLLISHRFSSVREADRIYVLDGGRVIEHGTHAALLDTGGVYAELFTLQAAAYTDPAPERAEA